MRGPEIGLASVLTAVVGCLWLGGAVETQQQRTLELDVVFGKYVFTFDPALITEERLRELAVLARHYMSRDDPTDYFVPRALEICVEASPDYLPCGSRRPGDENFLRNAQVNLEKGRRILEDLKRMRVPVELEPLLKFYQTRFAFFLWIQEMKFNYFRTPIGQALPLTYGEFNFSSACAAVTRKANEAQTPDERYSASNSWQNCMVGEFHKHIGDYPDSVWEGFLRKYRITAKYLDYTEEEEP